MKRVAQLSLLGFASVIAVGAVLLMMPVCSERAPLSAVDALFTATSATCVTGLTVLDTGSHFTWVGQAIILLLMQAGGLGIMTLSTGLLISLGRRASLDAQLAMAQDIAVMRVRNYRHLVWNIVWLTLAFEAVGACFLLPVFWHGHGAGQGLWSSVFHSVSAFCNAGFSLQSSSFCVYRAHPWVNLVLGLLIVAGGLGFVVLWEIWQYQARPEQALRRLSLHTKVVLTTTGALIVAGALLVWGIERNVTLANAGWFESAQCALFQSVTARTAGFNTIAIDGMSNATLFGVIVLMFVGASPCSTGGGIKTTTFAVLVMVTLSRFRGRETAACAGRALPSSVVSRAVTLVLASAVIVVLFTGALLMLEQGGQAHSESRGQFLEYLFEAVSAFGTVGLSMGVTSALSEPGKVLVAALMYIGRLGPMALMLALSKRDAADPYRYPTEEVVIG